MTAFSQKYPPEWRDAIARAIVDGIPGVPGRGRRPGLSAAVVCAMAARGEVPGVPRFDMNVSTARHYAKQLRHQRLAEHRIANPEPATKRLDDAVSLLADTAALEAARIHPQPGKPADIERLDALARTIQNIRKAARDPAKPSRPTAGQQNTPNAATGLVQTLAQKDTPAQTPSTPAPKPVHKDNPAPRATATKRPDQRRHDDTTGKRLTGAERVSADWERERAGSAGAGSGSGHGVAG
jgi:hypothetical protein